MRAIVAVLCLCIAGQATGQVTDTKTMSRQMLDKARATLAAGDITLSVNQSVMLKPMPATLAALRKRMALLPATDRGEIESWLGIATASLDFAKSRQSAAEKSWQQAMDAYRVAQSSWLNGDYQSAANQAVTVQSLATRVYQDALGTVAATDATQAAMVQVDSMLRRKGR